MLRRALRADCALPRGSRVLVAVSGGADSTALLAGLARIAPEFGLEVRAAHLHHRLRGAQADGDLDAVRSLCGRLGVPLDAARWNTRARMRRRGLAGQNGLRILRREFLAGVARRTSSSAVATAHTADDQLETLLMRLARGTALRGMGGIRPRSGRWIRPLLDCPRVWIEADLARAGVAWREDASNADPRYLRSRIRHEVVPALVRAGGPAGASGPSRAAMERARLALGAASATREIRGAERWLESRAKQALLRGSRIQRGEIDLDSRMMATFPSVLRRTTLRAAWRVVAGDSTGLTSRHLDALDRLIRPGGQGRRVDLPGGGEAQRENRLIRIVRRRSPGGRRGRKEDFAPARLQGRLER